MVGYRGGMPYVEPNYPTDLNCNEWSLMSELFGDGTNKGKRGHPITVSKCAVVNAMRDLFGRPAQQDSTTAARLRAAGAVILGKTNLSEFANFRSFVWTSGWSGRGGQTLNPYVLDRNPLGSSAGSAVAVAANLTTVAIGSETDGSITAPASSDGVVGIKPTVGLTSRAGVVPIAHSQDSIGPFGCTVADVAIVLGALVGVDPRDPATQDSAGKFHTDYTQFLVVANASPLPVASRVARGSRRGGFVGG